MKQINHSAWTRRQALASFGAGFGSLAFSGMSHAAANPATYLHHAPRAKRVIFLFMHGGVSQVDTFDYKPKLQEWDGKVLPFAPAKNLDPSATRQAKLLGSPWGFDQHGESGLWISRLFPQVARHADKLCVIRSMQSKGQSHGQAVCMLHTGTDNFIRPSVGSWVSYGLGTENNDLPGFVSIGPSPTHGGPRNYGAAFLPAQHQATTVGASGKIPDKASFRFLAARDEVAIQQKKLGFLQEMNRGHLARTQDAQIDGVIQSYELAFRMQQAAPPVMKMEDESEATRSMYGMDDEKTKTFGRQCLLARRMAESGVRYIQVSTANVWDQHGNLKKGHEKNALAVDKPIAGLLEDLEQRGLLDDTLVVWGSEFGRTPIVQGSNGRDHNPQGFTVWMAGAGVKGGFAYGDTDEFGYFAVNNKVHMHDLHATIMHLLGMDHEALTYRYAGRDFRLTDVYGDVVHELFA